MRTVGTIVKSITERQGFWNIDDIGGEARKFRGIAFIIGPPTIGVGAAVSRGEVREIAIDGAFDLNICRDA